MFTASDQMLQCPPRPLPMDRRWKSSVELAPNCPRCASSNTKFCYYNNYSLSQPRYFCKGCRRYWTKGGSLRNVPVGGGCRRNRRGKSFRVPPTDRVLVTCSPDFPSSGSGSPPNDPSGNSASSNGDSTVQPGSTDIDLAVVFAKFLNQNSSSETEFVGPELHNEANKSLDLPNTFSSDVVQEEMVIECEKPLDLIGGTELLEGINNIPEVFVEERIQELMLDNGPNALGLQTLLGDEVVQGALWSDALTTQQNFTLQPLVQFQGFESIPSDDELRISKFPMSDNWSSFDMSGFEVFLKP